jgi:hypothetical protein
MARIRTIKPEFWTDGTIVSLSLAARLFYIGTWNFTLCDRGHLPDDATRLKLQIMPADDVDAVALLDELITAGRIERIASSGRSFLLIPRFVDHQKLDLRWSSRCPVCTLEDSLKLPETRVSSLKLPETRRGGEGTVKDRGGVEDAASAASPFCPQHPTGTDKPCRACQRARIEYEQNGDRPKLTVSGTYTPPQCREHGYPKGECPTCDLAVAS